MMEGSVSLDVTEEKQDKLMEGLEKLEKKAAKGKISPEKLAKAQKIMASMMEGSVSLDVTSVGKDIAEQYQAVPGDELAAVKQKNAQLLQELQKAKSASIKAQQMLDTTMESMMQSMKHMHETV